MDSLYRYEEQKLNSLREQLPWMSDPKYFKKVKIGPSAAMKMMIHAQNGVNKGISSGGKPIEVMGLLVGRPDTNDTSSFVITDCHALPAEGFETRVVVDDIEVVNYMISVSDFGELVRKERCCGWYHSHPFEVGANNHCFLSSTDISTQLQWQRSEDPNGNPWLSLVIDPLRSVAYGKPEIGAFRVYPPEYSPPANELPDGTFETSDSLRVEKWGSCWNRYYQLETVYFMSSLAQKTLDVIRDKYLWANSIASSNACNSQWKAAENSKIATICKNLDPHQPQQQEKNGTRISMANKLVALFMCSYLGKMGVEAATSRVQEEINQIIKEKLFR